MASVNSAVTTILTYLGILGSPLTADPTTHKNWKLLNQGECGINYADRIIGGTRAALGQYPWLVIIGRIRNGNPFYHCGGAIITEKYILTAAHCAPKTDERPAHYRIRAGEHVFSSDPDCEEDICAPPVVERDVAEVIVHKDYNKDKQFQNDICLMRLEWPLEFSDFIKPICVPYGELATRDLTGQMMEVAGWGVTTLGELRMSDYLYYVKVPVMAHAKCKKMYKHLVKITETQLCVGGIVGKDSCGGDSGGPLMKTVQFDGTPRYFMFGVVSYGTTDCGKTKYPGIYTNISAHYPWILRHLSP